MLTGWSAGDNSSVQVPSSQMTWVCGELATEANYDSFPTPLYERLRQKTLEAGEKAQELALAALACQVKDLVLLAWWP